MSTTITPPPAPQLDPEPVEPTSVDPKGQRSWYQKKRFLIPGALVVLMVFGMAVAGSGDSPDDTTAAGTATAATDSTDDQADATAADEAAEAAAAEAAAEEAAAEEAAAEEAAAEEAAAEEAAAEEAAAEEAAAEAAAEEAAATAGTRENPLAIGETGVLPEWEVTIDEINLDADDILLDANLFNDEPENGNYGLVTLTATYTGDDEANAGFGLSVVLAGADSLQYSDSDAFVVEPDSMLEQPDVENGGTVTGQFALDFPDEAIGDGAVVFVEELISFDNDDRVFFQIPTS